MSTIRLHVVGVGDAFSELYYPSCFILESEGFRLLIDCPSPLRKALHDAGAPGVEEMDALLLTHIHRDHSGGLETLGFYRYFFTAKPTIPLYGSHDALNAVWPTLQPSMGQFSEKGTGKRISVGCEQFFDLRPLSWEGEHRIGPFSVKLYRTNHPVPTSAFIARVGAVSVGYSSDTSWDPNLIDFLSTADLIVHETNVGIHTPYEQLRGLSEKIKRRMRVIHYCDTFDPAGGEIRGLNQGELIEIGEENDFAQ